MAPDGTGRLAKGRIMPAVLRISQLVVEPQNPEAMAPLRFSAECANVGDEGTDPVFRVL